MSLSFDNIPIDIKTFGQYLEINNSRAVTGPVAKPHRCLIIGQRTTAGTVAQKIQTLLPSKDSGDTYFGARSHAAAMCRSFKNANPYTELWGIALDDNAGGVARTQTLTVTGPATADGVIYIYFGGRRLTVSVKSGDAQNAIATALNAAIQAASFYPKLPFTSAVATNVVTLTHANKGTVANSYDVRLNYQQGEALPAGVGVAIAQGVAGSTDPLLQDALDAIGDVQYDTIACSMADSTSLTALSAFLVARWGPMNMKDGQAFVAANGTLSTLTSLGSGLNQFVLTVLGVGGKTAGVGSTPTPLWDSAAIAAGVSAFRATIDPARPLQTLVLTGILPMPEGERFTREERQTLLSSGISTCYVDAGGTVRIERLITTYQKNPLNIADPSYLDLTTVRTLSQLRYEVRATIGLKYPRHKLADDGTRFDPGQAVVTPSTIKAELISLFRSWEGRGLVENFAQFKADLIVERDATDRNRVNMRMSPDLINQFVVFAGQIQFLL